MIRKIGILILILVSFGVLYGLVSQIYTSLGAGNRLVEAKREVEDLQRENDNLKKELENESTLSYLEKNTRDKLLMARPGETVVIIDPKKIEEVIASESAQAKVVLPNWQGWLKLFGITF